MERLNNIWEINLRRIGLCVMTLTSNYNRANDVAVWEPTPKTADVTVTKIAGYVRVRILMNRRFCRIFCIQRFYATTTLLNMSLSPAMNMWLTDASDLTVVVGAVWTHACNTLRRSE